MTTLPAASRVLVLPRLRLAALLPLLAATLAWAGAAFAVEVPFLTGRVVDEANILSDGVEQNISQMSERHEQKTGNQVVVLTAPSLEGESIEGFATQVFEAWKLGQKGKDNGVLVIVAPNDRKMRIEVGYGLEGTLTDAGASRIIRETMTPQFKNGNFEAGIQNGVTAIVQALEGEGSWNEPGSSSTGMKTAFSDIEDQLPPWPMRILLGAFIFGIIGLFTFIGIMTPGVGWFLYVFLIPFWAMFPIIVLGVKGALVLLAIYLVGFPIAKLVVKRQPWYEKAAKEMKSKGSTTIGGMVITSGGRSGGGGFSSGGGGFSGGGGSSGGGGASGSW